MPPRNSVQSFFENFKYLTMIIKLILICLALIGDVANSSPVYDKNAKANKEIRRKPNYMLLPDINGRLVLEDINNAEIEPRFNAEKDVKFLLYTRENPESPDEIFISEAAIRNSHFKSQRNTRFVIHGWNSDGGQKINTLIRDALLKAKDLNVIVVDWGIGAHTINYLSARNRVNEVGPLVARLINFMNSNGFLKFDQVNIIGHSLGAHTAGIAGKNTDEKVSVLFSLDPAGPLFDTNKPNERFHEDDARYTVAIHTNAGILGFSEPLANVDFYPNGGKAQPGCGLDLAGSCSHSRSYELFSESIVSDRFIAHKCNSVQDAKKENCDDGEILTMLGEITSLNVKGIYHLRTNSQSPFALGI